MRLKIAGVVSISWSNNAGVSYRAVQEHLEEKDEVEQFAVNYFGPMKLVRRVLPFMRNQHWGRIIIVS